MRVHVKNYLYQMPLANSCFNDANSLSKSNSCFFGVFFFFFLCLVLFTFVVPFVLLDASTVFASFCFVGVVIKVVLGGALMAAVVQLLGAVFGGSTMAFFFFWGCFVCCFFINHLKDMLNRWCGAGRIFLASVT